MTPTGAAVSREEFLSLLESVQAGLSPREIVQQSSCFVFRDGELVTFNQDVACRVESGLPKEYRGAVQAKPVLDQLRKWPDDTVTISFRNGFHVKAGPREMELNMEREVFLPLEGIEAPGTWKPMHEDFTDAIGVVESCAGKDESHAALTCIHLTPDHIEACDNFQLTRYRFKTGVSECCVKRDSLKIVPQLEMRDVSETKEWLHFKSRTGLVLSLRKHDEQYMALDPFLDVKGIKTELPKGLNDAVERAKILSDETADTSKVLVDLQGGKLKIKGEGASGWFSETKKIKYSGPDIKFEVGPDLLLELIKRHTDCVVSPELRLMVDGPRWRYVACLEPPARDAAKEPEAKEDE